MMLHHTKLFLVTLLEGVESMCSSWNVIRNNSQAGPGDKRHTFISLESWQKVQQCS